MPIVFRVDHAHRIVVAVAHGVIVPEEMFEYQRELEALPGIAGYDELVDMTPVTRIEESGSPRIRHLATVAASGDSPASRTRFAIVAPTDLAFGLGRMYQAYRAGEPGSTKEVGVFRSMDEARAFLGIEGPLAPPDWSAG